MRETSPTFTQQINNLYSAAAKNDLKELEFGLKMMLRRKNLAFYGNRGEYYKLFGDLFVLASDRKARELINTLLKQYILRPVRL